MSITWLVGTATARFRLIGVNVDLKNNAGERVRFLEAGMGCLAPGAPFVLFTYGRKPPVPAPKGATVKRAAYVWRNFPPAGCS